MKKEYTETIENTREDGIIEVTIIHFREMKTGDSFGGPAGITENGVEKTTHFYHHIYEPNGEPDYKKYAEWLEKEYDKLQEKYNKLLINSTEYSNKVMEFAEKMKNLF